MARTFVLAFSFAFWGQSCLDGAATVSAERPNILLVMVDDMGWGDLGCYGGEIQTPHIDALAEKGLRFAAFYNTGRCCPTRASLLTGRYPHAAGMGRMTFDAQQPGYRGELSPDVQTIAERLRTAGYRTAMVGKWHLSLTESNENHMTELNNQVIRETFADPATYPVGRGFERHYGVIWGVVNYFDPFSLVEGTQAIDNVPDDYYLTDALTERTLEYLEDFAGGDEPFFSLSGALRSSLAAARSTGRRCQVRRRVRRRLERHSPGEIPPPSRTRIDRPGENDAESGV